MKLVDYNFFKDKNLKIEDNIFCFSSEYDKLAKEFVSNLIKENFNKKLKKLNDDELRNMSDIISKLNPSKILYAIIGLLHDYSFTDESEYTNKIEKILIYLALEQYRNIILDIVDINTEKLEKFEKENNISIIIETDKL